MKVKKIFIASDHAGYNLKENIKKSVLQKYTSYINSTYLISTKFWT